MRCFTSVLLFLALATTLSAQTNVTFRSKISYPGIVLSNLWGYSAGGLEYALVGTETGTSIVNVTDPDNPVVITEIATAGSPSNWREIKTYQHYAYVVSEGAQSGVQIIDLTNLPNSNLTHHTYKGNGAINNLLTKAHALHVDVTAGYLYVYGSQVLFGGKAIILNLNGNPNSPNYVNYINYGGSGNAGYVHDGYVDGDFLYAAHIYAGNFGIYNVTNKSNPIQVTTVSTPGLFTHNTWRNGNVIYTTDEVNNSFLASYDITNTGNITLLDKIQSNPGTSSMVHNTYILNDYAITSWYRDGFTLVDVARPANMVQVGNYDTYGGSGSGGQGCWGVYPYLPSGTILASNIQVSPSNETGELYICTPTYVRGCYLEGKVTNASNSNPINGALVKIIGPNIQESTLSNGLYKMGLLLGNTYSVEVSKSGFTTSTSVVTLSNGNLTTLDVALQQVILPVELTRFSARPDNRDALLDWETASETDNAGFEIQQSADGVNWEKVGFVNAQGPSTYEFRVPNLSPGKWFFRLRQLDRNGTVSFSDAEPVAIKGTKFSAELLPNTVIDYCRLRLSSEYASAVKVEIFDAKLQPVGLSWNIEMEQTAMLPITVGHFPVGTYYVVVETDRERVTVVLVKQ